jgi:hypothetical protein
MSIEILRESHTPHQAFARFPRVESVMKMLDGRVVCIACEPQSRIAIVPLVPSHVAQRPALCANCACQLLQYPVNIGG